MFLIHCKRTRIGEKELLSCLPHGEFYQFYNDQIVKLFDQPNTRCNEQKESDSRISLGAFQKIYIQQLTHNLHLTSCTTLQEYMYLQSLQLNFI